MSNNISTYCGAEQLALGVLISAQPLTMKETIRTGKTNKGLPCTGCGKRGWNVCHFKHKQYSDHVLKTTTVTLANDKRVVTTLVTLECKGNGPLVDGWNTMQGYLPFIPPRSSRPAQPQPQPHAHVQPDTTFSSFQTFWVVGVAEMMRFIVSVRRLEEGVVVGILYMIYHSASMFHLEE